MSDVGFKENDCEPWESWTYWREKKGIRMIRGHARRYNVSGCFGLKTKIRRGLRRERKHRDPDEGIQP